MAYSSITKPGSYFNTVTYTGNGASTRSITGVGFQPDWVWVKCRSTGHDHYSWDVVRTDKKGLEPSDTAMARTPTLGSFDSDGFSFASLDSFYNANSDTYVSWNWIAGNSTGSSNGDGSITSTVSANTTAGFSIIDFTGTEASGSVGHGLGVAPSVFIMRRYTDDGYSSTSEWYFYHKSLASNKYLALQSINAAGTNDGSLWNTSTPVTASVINIGSNANSNHSGTKTIIYAFAEKKGYSKFGSYTGNGNADGTFVYTGFKPAWVITKNATNGSTSWSISDNKRPGFNVINDILFSDSSGVEQTFNYIDHLSNGFKIRYTSDSNTNGSDIIYMAFAETPFVANDSGTAVPVVAG